MPWIIDYQNVLERLQLEKLRCLYHNSGAFGFEPGVMTFSRGWIGPVDGSIRSAAMEMTQSVAMPYEKNLAELATRVWQEKLPGSVWVMPKSHWAYELDFGSRDWMPSLLENIDIDPGMLQGRNNGSAIEFAPHESKSFESFVERLLQMLIGSDFEMVFPGRETICTIHSHKQLWWTTASEDASAGLDQIFPKREVEVSGE